MISKEEVLTVAALARLELSDQEIESLQKDISSILDYVGQVSQAAVALSPQPLHRNAMREDAPRGPKHLLAEKEEALRAAFPNREGDFNVVRKIIEK